MPVDTSDHPPAGTDEVLAALRHDLCTPATGLLGLCESLLLGVYGPLTERQRGPLQLIARSAERWLALLTDLLDWSQAHAGRLPVQAERLAVGAVCAAAVAAVRPLADDKQQVVSSTVRAPQAALWGDGRRLQHALEILLGYAIHVSPAHAQIGLEADAEAGMIHVRVSDAGDDLAAAELARLFEPHGQRAPGDVREAAAARLGLALARQLAVLHGGQLSAASTPGRGCCFTLSLPQHAPRGDAPA